MTKKRCAFTLVEIMITIGIIGIVAAITIPTMLQNSNSKKFATQLKKSISTLNQASIGAQAQYDVKYSMMSTESADATCGSDSLAKGDMTFCSLLPRTIILSHVIFLQVIFNLDIYKKIVIIMIMKKIILLVLAIFVFSIQAYSDEVTVKENKNDLPEIQIDLRDKAGVEIPAGIVVPVINMQEVSTETCPEGYKVKFVSTNDLYIGDIKVLPEDTVFYGYIEKINEPIVGTNASMKVKVTKFVFPDGYEENIKAYIYTSNDNLIGGELTAPSEWVKMPHYQDTYQGISWIHRGATLQLRPGGKRSMGTHTKLPVGERHLIIFTAPSYINHLLAE